MLSHRLTLLSLLLVASTDTFKILTVEGSSSNSSSVIEVDCSKLRDNPISLVQSELILHAIIDPIEETLTVELVREGQGWLALGFYSGNPTMKGSQAVIGTPDEAIPAKYNLYSYGVEKMEDSQQTLINATTSTVGSQTVVSFTKLLKESNENEIAATGDSFFLWAIGSSSTIAYHAKRGSIAITINQCIVTENGVVMNAGQTNQQSGATIGTTNDYRNLWIAHGATAATAWAILVPLAVGSSLIRKLIEQATGAKTLWFELHRGLNALAAILTIASFSIAVSILSNQSGYDHFSSMPHHVLGLVIFILTLLQALNGMLRPHLPHTEEMVEVAAQDDEEEEKVVSQPIPAKVEDKSTLRIAWEIGHRVLGVSLVGMSWWQVQNGLGLFLMRFPEDMNMIPVFWGVALGITGVVLVLYLGQMFLMKGKSE